MKKTDTTATIKTILTQVYVENDDLFYVKGRSFRVTQRTPYMQWNRPLNSFGENTGDDSRKREKLLAELSGCIYSTFYVSGDPNGQWMDENVQPSAEEKNKFMDTLSAANQTVESWDPLWTVISTDPSGNVSVKKNGMTRMLMPNEWKPAQPYTGPLPIGATVSLLIKKEKRDLQPVFYYVYGTEFLPYDVSLGRFYFNLKPEGTAELIRALTTSFNKMKVPFMFKCLNHPSLYVRTDSAVLYIEKNRFHISARLLRDIIKKHARIFNTVVPMFSKEIASGVSYAEDPGNGKSFGMFWSDLLAEGIVKAYEKGITSAHKKEELIFGQFKNNGVDPEASHMRSNSFFPYDFSVFN